MTVAVVDANGKILTRRCISNDMAVFLQVVAPYRESISVAVESTFNWMWFVDCCRDHGLDIHLGHAFAMQLIHKSKHKRDRLDAVRIAQLLRGGFLPEAYAAMPELRRIRDLLRFRTFLKQQRTAIFSRTTIALLQNGCIETADKLASKRGRAKVCQSIADPILRQIVTIGLAAAEQLENHIAEVEETVRGHTEGYLQSQQQLLCSVPGVGEILSWTIIYEIDDIGRFKRRQHLSSYCRLVKPEHESDGKRVGGGNRKCGNSALKWAMMQIVSGAVKKESRIARMADELKERHEPLKARAILANKFCTAIYYMLKHQQPFDLDRFCGQQTVKEADSQEHELDSAQAA
jgi:transposase